MAVPVVQAVGAGTGATGDITVTLPSHATNDILLLFVESAGGQPVTAPTGGWAAVTNSPQATGVGTAGTQLSVFWLRATSGSTTNPLVLDAGNHTYGTALAIRGCPTNGTPWELTAGSVKGTGSTATSIAGVTTTSPDVLALYATTRDNDAGGAHWSSEANANLTSLTEQFDEGTTQGNGGGIAIWTGVLATPGPTGTLTATVSTTVVEAFLCIALVGGVFASEAVSVDDSGHGTIERISEGGLHISDTVTAAIVEFTLSRAVTAENVKVHDTAAVVLNPLQATTPASEALQLTDTPTVVLDLGALPSESVKVVDTATTLLNPLETSQSDSLKVVDALTGQVVLLANVASESLKIVDVNISRATLLGVIHIEDGPVIANMGGGIVTRPPDEELVIRDTLTVSRGLTASVSESLTIADALTVSRGLTASLTEPLTLAETHAELLNPLQAETDGEDLKVTDSPNEQLTLLQVSVSESLKLSESAAGGTSTLSVLVAQEVIHAVDRVIILSAVIGESLRLVDVGFGRSTLLGVVHVVDGPPIVNLSNLLGTGPSESLRITDSLSVVRTPLETTVSETLRLGTSGDVELTRDEELRISEALFVSLAAPTDLSVAVQEPLEIADALTARRGLDVLVGAESLAIVDTPIPLLDELVTLTEPLSIVDTVLVSRDLSPEPSESLVIADAVTPTLDPLEPSASDTLIVADNVTADLLQDATTLSVALNVESLSLVEALSVSITLETEISEALGIADISDVEGPPLDVLVDVETVVLAEVSNQDIDPLIADVDQESLAVSDALTVIDALPIAVDAEVLGLADALAVVMDLATDTTGTVPLPFLPDPDRIVRVQEDGRVIRVPDGGRRIRVPD
jgi:hypothetical protein